VFEERRSHLGKDAEKMESIINQRQKRVLKDLTWDRLSIDNNNKSAREDKQELEESLKHFGLRSSEARLSS
jgi:hypothetical protein